MASPVSGYPGEDDPLYRVGVMLINGYGYNWYRLDNQMRADDLLVRSRASEHLAARRTAAVNRSRQFDSAAGLRPVAVPVIDHGGSSSGSGSPGRGTCDTARAHPAG